MMWRDEWTTDQAMGWLLAENWRAQQERVKVEVLPTVEQIRELLHVSEDVHESGGEVLDTDEWPEDFDHEDYQKWLDEQNEGSRRAHDEWLEELYAAEELERMEREREEGRNDH